MIPDTSAFIDVLLQHTQRFVIPSATTPDAKLGAMMLNMVLSHLATEALDGEEIAISRVAAARPILIRVRELISQLHHKSGSPGPGAAALLIDLDAALTEPSSAKRLDRALSAALAFLHTIVEPKANDAAELMKEIVARETAFLAESVRAYDRRHLGTAFTEQKIKEQPVLSVENVDQYFKERFKGAPPLRATRVAETGGGFAKRTYLLDTEGGPAAWKELVIRQDVIGGPTPASMLDEVDVIRYAHANAIPVPQIFHLEPDPGALGAPFFLAARMPGVCSDASWTVRRPGEPAPGEQLARIVGHLHALRPQTVHRTLHAVSRAGVVKDYVQSFADRWMRDRPNDEPLLHAGFDWLLANVPHDIPQLTIVHADISPRNVLMDEGMVSAILDWELWHVGDPAYDLAYIRRWLAGWMEWNRFIEIYHDHGGGAVNLDNLSYWDVFFCFRDSAMLASGMRSFLDGKNRNLKMIAPVMYYYRRCLAEGAQLLHDRL